MYVRLSVLTLFFTSLSFCEYSLESLSLSFGDFVVSSFFFIYFF